MHSNVLALIKAFICVLDYLTQGLRLAVAQSQMRVTFVLGDI
jgi:hypothetical protein